MDIMSLFSVLTVSVPEAILDIYLAFLITGEKTHLYLDDKINIIRLLIVVPLMVASVFFVRAIAPSIVVVLLLNIILYTMIIKFVYNMPWHKSLINVLIIYGFLVSFEVVYTPIFFNAFNINFEKFLSDDIVRLLYTLPERAAQIFIIISLWNWNKAFFNLKNYKGIRFTFSAFMIILLTVEVIFLFIVTNSLDKLSLIYKVIYIIGFLLFAAVNFLSFKFVSVITNAVAMEEMNAMLGYKKKVGGNLKKIHHHLKNGEIESAKRLCEETLQ